MMARPAPVPTEADDFGSEITRDGLRPVTPARHRELIAEGFAAIERGDMLTEDEMDLEFERMLADLPAR